MKYEPRHPALNFVFAVVCFLSGFAFIVVGLLAFNEQDYWYVSGLGINSTTIYLTSFGLLWAALGGFGIFWHVQYFRRRRKTKN
jgi:hypothetical protein